MAEGCPYDDAYKILATSLVVDLSPSEIGTLLTDKSYIRLLVKREVQNNLDIAGPFSDAVVEEAVKEDWLAWKQTLGDFSTKIYERLDIPRLRMEVRVLCKSLGVEPVFLNTKHDKV